MAKGMKGKVTQAEKFTCVRCHKRRMVRAGRWGGGQTCKACAAKKED